MAKRNHSPQPTDDRKGGVYPYGSLSSAIRLGEAVYVCGGSSGKVPKSVVAHKLGVSDSASGFYTQIANAKCFGVVDGKTDLWLTEESKDFFMPVDAVSKRKAELAFFVCPESFKALAKRFDGHKVPDATMLSNILVRETKVPASWSVRVATFFTTTAQDLQLIDAHGILRYSVALHSANSVSVSGDDDDEESSESSLPPASSTVLEYAMDYSPLPAAKLNPLKYAASPKAATQVSARTDSDVWVHPSGIKVEVPVDLTPELWDRLNRHVQSLKPASGPKEGAMNVVRQSAAGMAGADPV